MRLLIIIGASSYRQTNFNCCAVAVRPDIKPALHNSDPFTHSRNAYSEKGTTRVKLFENVRSYAATLVGNHRGDLLGILADADLRHTTSRMAVNIRETLLHYPEQGSFSIAG